MKNVKKTKKSKTTKITKVESFPLDEKTQKLLDFRQDCARLAFHIHGLTLLNAPFKSEAKLAEFIYERLKNNIK